MLNVTCNARLNMYTHIEHLPDWDIVKLTLHSHYLSPSMLSPPPNTLYAKNNRYWFLNAQNNYSVSLRPIMYTTML